MPKMKTVKAIKAKFRVTGTGKLKRHRPGKRHHAAQKSPKRKRQLAKAAYVDHTYAPRYTRMMGV